MIPRTIHQIWIGPKPIPTQWTDNIKEMAAKTGFGYKLWRDADIAKFGLNMLNIYEATPTWYGKADIARYEILFRLGGIYVDADSVCVNRDAFVRLIRLCNINKCTSFIGYEPPSVSAAKHELMANGVIGTIPDSIFMKKCIQEIKARFRTYESWSDVPAWVSTGPKLTTKVIERIGNAFPSEIKGVASYVKIRAVEKIFLLEDYIFYPVTWHGITSIDLPTHEFDSDTVFYQYGYSTNNLELLFEDKKELDTAYVINLEHRTDRLEQIRESIKGLLNLRRINAISHDNGAVGCLTSHILTVDKHFGQFPDSQYCLVLEDDFIPDADFTNKFCPQTLIGWLPY
jgi:hypothetical protein